MRLKKYLAMKNVEYEKGVASIWRSVSTTKNRKILFFCW
jgi:hypothetical protein